MKTERSRMVHKAAREPLAKHPMPLCHLYSVGRMGRGKGRYLWDLKPVFASLPLTPQGSKHSQETLGMTLQGPSNLTNK